MPRTTETSRPVPAPALKLSHNPDEFDALAELFLGGDPAEPPAPAAPNPPRGPIVRPAPAAAGPIEPESQPASALSLELLILGHLPVRASPWVSQYARLVAEKLAAPVALVRAVGSDLAIDVFGLPTSVRPENPHSDFARAISAAAAVASHWVLQFDEITEPQIASDPRVSALTLVAGANEAAVVAAYRTLKSLAPNGDGPPGEDSESEESRFRVAVMGAEGQAAADAAAKLQQAARVFLGRPVGFAGAIARIGPTGASGFYRGTAPAGGSALIDSLLDAARASIASAAKPASGLSPVAGQPFAPPEKPTSDTSRLPVSVVDSPVKAASLSSRLASTVLTPFAAKCPDDPAAELAVDGDGRLHVLRDAEGPDSYQRLAGVLAWATRHRELLALASPTGARLDPAAGVIGHLFTREPKAMLHVAQTEVKLHLFAPANVGASGGWCCVDLN